MNVFSKRKLIISKHASGAFQDRNENEKSIEDSLSNARIILENKNHIYMQNETLKYPCVINGQHLIVKSALKRDMKMIPYD